MRLIVKLSDVDVGERVCKANGSTKYTVQDQIKIYNSDTVITAEEGVRFLVGERGGINATPADTKVALDYAPQVLLRFLERKIMEEDAK